MRYLKHTVGLLAGFVSITAGIQSAYAADGITGYINTSSVNIRAEASTSSYVLGQVHEQQNISVLGVKQGFFHVQTPEHEGFVAKQFVDLRAIGTVYGNDVNVRAGASTDYDVIKTASVGQEFTVIGGKDGWFRLELDDDTAYIFGEFLRLDYGSTEQADPSDTPPATTTQDDDHSTPPQSMEALLLELLEHFPETPPQQESSAPPAPNSILPLLSPGESSLEDEAPEYDDEQPLPPSDSESAPASILPLVGLPLHNPTNQQDGQQSESGPFVVVSYAVGVPLLEAPDSTSETIRHLYPTKLLDIVSSVPGSQWVRVVANGLFGEVQGYVYHDHITINDGDRPTPPAPNTPRAREIISYAIRYLGTPYVFGGTDLQAGVDCSGFIFSVMLSHGIELGRSSRDMFNNGVPVSQDELAPGDLLFFSANGRVVTHVALYMGDDQYIHSTDFRDMGVSFARLSSDYSQRTYFGARRVVD